MTYTPVPESELTEEEVRRGFNRLRELYQGEMHRVHEMKVERGKMKVEIERLGVENSRLTKRNKYLENLLERMQKRKEKKVEKKEPPKLDFKKKFLDSL